MRIGERLVAAGLITPQQLKGALRQQVLRGGRVGTNLVELGAVNVDALARVLGHQHGMPAALQRHFDGCDRLLQERLPRALAVAHRAVPLARTRDGRLAVAMMDPPSASAQAALETALGGPIVAAITAELRVLYALESVYGVRRSARFIRVRGETVPPELGGAGDGRPDASAAADAESEIDIPIDVEDGDEDGFDVDVDIDGDDDLDLDIVEMPPVRDATSDSQVSVAADARVGSADPDIHENKIKSIGYGSLHEPQPVPSSPAGTARPQIGGGASPDGDGASASPSPRGAQLERRRFVEPLSSDGVPVSPSSLGRIAIRRVSASGPVVSAAPDETEPADLDQTLRAIRRATGRDRVGDLVIAALRDFFDDAFDAAAVFIVREPLAIGWKGFCRGAPDGGSAIDAIEAIDAIDAIAVPLDQPSALRDAHSSGDPVIGPPAGGGTEVERQMWRQWGVPPPASVFAIPVDLQGQIVCLVYAHGARAADAMSPAAREAVPRLADAMRKAFRRLILASQR